MSFGETFTAFGSLGDAFRQGRQRDALAALGARVQDGDYAGAARGAFEAGDPGTAVGLLKLGELAKTRALEDAAGQNFANGIGAMFGGPGASSGTEALGVPRQSSASPSVPSFLDSSSPSGSYVAGLFKRESNNNDFAQAPTSSARGAGQFTKGTWNDLAAKQPGLGLTPVGNGQDGRTDRGQMLRATNALTAQNESVLQGSGLPVTDATRYALHFLGAGGGRRLVAGAMRNPDAPAASYADAAQVAANRNVFFNRDGSPKSGAQVMSDFGRSFGGGGASTVRQAQAVPAPGPVAYADDEASVQALEARMGMVPPASPSRQVASADPQADTPAPGAHEAAFVIPPGGAVANPAPGLSGAGEASARARPVMSLPSSSSNAPAPVSNSGGGVMTMPGEAPGPSQAAAQVPPDAMVGNQPASAISAAPAGQKIPFLMRALSSPYLKDGQRELASMLLKQALSETQMPETVREFMWAKAHGMTQAASPNEYALERQRNPGADLSSQVQAREQAAQRQGLQPGTPEYRDYVLTGKGPTDRPDKAPTVRTFTDAAGNKVDRVFNSQTGTWDPIDFGANPLPKPPADDTTGVPPGVDPDAYRKELAKKTVAQQSLATDRAAQARNVLPILDRAEQAYRALGDAKAIGPISASSANRFVGGVFGANAEKLRQEYEAAAKDLELYKAQISMKGQGAITEGERRLLALTLPRLDAADPATGLRTLKGLREQFTAALSADRLPSYGQGGAQRSAAPQGAPADRFGQLIGSGMTKAQAYEQMHREGY